MALAKHALIVVSIFAILLFAQCSTSARTPSPSPTPTPTEENSSPTHAPAPTPTPTVKSGPSADDDSEISTSELYELSLPDIGVQKAAVAPQTEGAKVAKKQLEGIEHKMDEFKAILTRRQAGPTSSESSKKCLAQCQENLEDAIDGVNISIESINNQDLSKANVDISGIGTDVEKCNDCFIELDGVDKDINAFNDWVKGVTKECLNNLKKT